MQKRWQAFAGPLEAADCEALVRRAAAQRLATTRVEPLTSALATDGWNLQTRGYVEHARPRAFGATAGPQLALALQPV